jgi:hypothetical protein
MTIAEIFADVRPVKEISTDDLRLIAELRAQHKLWGWSRGYEIVRELQERVTRQWVIEDVFGHTFTGI